LWYLSGMTPFPLGFQLANDTPVVGNWSCVNPPRDGPGVTRHVGSVAQQGVLEWRLSAGLDSIPEYVFNFGDGVGPAWPGDVRSAGGVSIDRPSSSRWSTNPSSRCSNPVVVRSGATTWIRRSGVGATGSTTTLTSPATTPPFTANDYAIPANWDLDSTDDAVAGW
jgi:hypothetical protein